MELLTKTFVNRDQIVNYPECVNQLHTFLH